MTPRRTLAATRSACVAARLAPRLLAPRSSRARAGRGPERTGRLLVTLDDPKHERRRARRRRRRARPQRRAPRRRPGPADQPRSACGRSAASALAALARILRRVPGVHSVDVEHRLTLRFAPNDPALTTNEPTPGTPSGTPIAVVGHAQRPARRLGRHEAATARPSPSSTPASTAGTPTCRARSRTRSTTTPSTATARRRATRTATARTSPRWPARRATTALGSVGSGLNCKLLIFKTDLSDGSIARSIVQAADRGADAINMSFGSDGGAGAAGGRRRGRVRVLQGRHPRRRRRRPARSRSRATRRTSCSRPAPARTSPPAAGWP